jgi:hypothetical protein
MLALLVDRIDVIAQHHPCFPLGFRVGMDTALMQLMESLSQSVMSLWNAEAEEKCGWRWSGWRERIRTNQRTKFVLQIDWHGVKDRPFKRAFQGR